MNVYEYILLSNLIYIYIYTIYILYIYYIYTIYILYICMYAYIKYICLYIIFIYLDLCIDIYVYYVSILYVIYVESLPIFYWYFTNTSFDGPKDCNFLWVEPFGSASYITQYDCRSRSHVVTEICVSKKILRNTLSKLKLKF